MDVIKAVTRRSNMHVGRCLHVGLLLDSESGLPMWERVHSGSVSFQSFSGLCRTHCGVFKNRGDPEKDRQ